MFGVPDDEVRRGAVCLDQVAKRRRRDEESIREFCRDRIAHYKVPRYIRFVENFP